MKRILKIVIVALTMFLLSCSSYNYDDTMDAQLTIADIYKHSLMYHRDKGVWPTSINDLRKFNLDSEISKMWRFKLISESTKIHAISAISNDNMECGAGKIVFFNTVRGTWSGHGMAYCKTIRGKH